ARGGRFHRRRGGLAGASPGCRTPAWAHSRIAARSRRSYGKSRADRGARSRAATARSKERCLIGMPEALAVDRLDAFVEVADYAVVGPTDNRVQEANTRRFPFNTICYLGRDFGDGRLRGCSGVLIAPRLVLTAAHCLYNLLLGRAPSRLVVMPG